MNYSYLPFPKRPRRSPTAMELDGDYGEFFYCCEEEPQVAKIRSCFTAVANQDIQKIG